jgi:hypothetical protein
MERVAGFLLRLLPLALLVTSAGALVGAVLAWGAAGHVEIPGWMTTFIGLAFAVPGMAISGLVLREVVRRTQHDFSTFYLQLGFGVLAMLVAIVVEAGLAIRIGDASTYDNLRNSDGTINTSPSGFMYIGLFAAVILAAAVGLAGYIYAQAVSPSVPTRFDRRRGEADAIGELLQGRRGPGADPR